MSGITALLDTLLHQVLGKRIDTARPERQPAAVKPLTPAQGVQPVRSDSRLDPRAPAPLTRGEVAPRSAAAKASSVSGYSPAVQSHLSRVAQQLSNILTQQPEVTRTIQSAPTPLAPPGASVATVAAELQKRIELSGLFYESHLQRWHRGERDRSLLEREPQMEIWRRYSADTVKFEAATQGLIRHQLELLATQKLRWEGELWPGMFVEFAVHPVSGKTPEPADSRKRRSSFLSPQAWCAEINLELENLGPVALSATVAGKTLNVKIVVVTDAVAAQVFAMLEPLRQRLLAVGFEKILVDVTLAE